MATAYQTATLFTPGQVDAPLQGRAGRSLPLASDAAGASEGARAEFFRSLVAYLSGSGGPPGHHGAANGGVLPGSGSDAGPGAGPLLAGLAAGLQTGSGVGNEPGVFLPAGGQSLPPGLTREARETLEAAAEALGMDVGELLHQVAQLANGYGHSGEAGGTPAANLAAASGAGAVREAGSEPAQPAPRPEPAAARAADPLLQGLTGSGATTGEGGHNPQGQQSQSTALHAALQKALSHAGRQDGTPDLTQAQLQAAEGRPADSLLGGLATVSQTSTAGMSAERAFASGTLNTPFNQQGWGEEVGQRIRWMVGNNMQAATLKLNPPQLGPIDVRISVQNDQLSIVFTAQHALVREALEESMPRLRELMGEKGFDSVDVDVSEDSSAHDRRSADADSDGALPGHDDNPGDVGAQQDGAEPGDDAGHDDPHLASPRWGGVDFYA